MGLHEWDIRAILFDENMVKVSIMRRYRNQ